jgi:hypothetical protein
MKRGLAALLSVLAIAAAACSEPPYSQIEDDFLREHPGAEVLSVGPGEGDSQHVYVHIRYGDAETKREREQSCLWQRIDQTWMKAGHCQTT